MSGFYIIIIIGLDVSVTSHLII